MSGSPYRRIAIASVVAGLLTLMTSCTPAPRTSSASEACAPNGTAIAGVTVRIIAAEPGATLEVEQMWHLNPGGGPEEDSGTYSQVLGGLAADQVRSLANDYFPDPGRCLHLFPTGAVEYQVTLIAADPVTQLLYATGYRPHPGIYGFPRGTVPMLP